MSKKTKKYRSLLGVNADFKTSKGTAKGYLTGILYLAPANLVKGLNLCPFASKGCKAACLYSAGRGAFNNVQQARISKTELFRDNLDFFMASLIHDIKKLERKAKRDGLMPVVRLNGTSDIRWENIRHSNGKNIFEIFPNIQFYDYTKDFKRLSAIQGYWKNYHLTLSLTESNLKPLLLVVKKWKINVAAVFRDELPESWHGIEVINGDETDLRFLDKRGVIVGLKAKGKAKKDVSGFVQDIQLNSEVA